MSTTVPLELIESKPKLNKKDIRAHMRAIRRARMQKIVMWRIDRLQRDKRKVWSGKGPNKMERAAAIDSKIQNLYGSIGHY